MRNLTNENRKTGGLTRRLSARNNSCVKTTIRIDAIEQESITGSIIVAGYLLVLASVTVMAFVS